MIHKSMNRCKATRPFRSSRSATAVQPVARLFVITRLNSHEPSVEVATSTTPVGSVNSSPEDLSADVSPGVTLATATSTVPPSVPGLPSNSRRSLQAAAGRKLWYPSRDALRYLDGSLPGDYGWDPLGLADPSKRGQPGEDKFINLEWMAYAELIHGRWAMLAAAGAVAPEALALAGLTPTETGLPWFESGGLFSNTPGGIQGIPFLGDIPFTYWADKGTLMYTMLAAMGFAELRRLQDYKYPGSMGQQYFLGLEAVMKGSGNPRYPGGQFFDLFGLGMQLQQDPDGNKLLDMREKEVKNGRLAMVAWLGFMTQACTTHEGPVKNLLDHMAEPAANNMFARIGDFYMASTPAQQVGYVLWLAAGFAAGALFTYARDSTDEQQSRSAGTASSLESTVDAQ